MYNLIAGLASLFYVVAVVFGLFFFITILRLAFKAMDALDVYIRVNEKKNE